MRLILGADEKFAWMLPWWVANYERHNQYPVVFVDYGLSPKSREFCRQHGSLVDLPPTPDYPNAWFYKPHLLTLPRISGKLIAIDLDTEIKGDLKPIFDAITSPDRLYAVPDVLTPRGFEHCKPFFNGGVIASYSGSHAALTWRDWTEAKWSKYRDDQRILSELHHSYPASVASLPAQFNRLRLDRNREPDDLIHHWTGPKGKAIIRDKIQTDG